MDDKKDFFTTSQVSDLYQVSPQTVRLWAKEFAAYLSPSATPTGRKKRVYTSDDMTVFDLIYKERQHHKDYDQIHGILAGGQRGIAPDGLPEQIDLLRTVEAEKRLALQIEALRSQVNVLAQENNELKHFRDENIELKTELRLLRERLEELTDLRTHNSALEREIGKLQAMLDLLREQFLGDDKPRRR